MPRTPFMLPTRASYLAWRRDVMGEELDTSLKRGFRLFPVHNKYTPADWQWLLAEARFAIRHQTQLRPTHTMFVTAPTGE